MKDKTVMMLDHILSNNTVDEWAKEKLKETVSSYLSDGCTGCEFVEINSWEMPCKACVRKTLDYWRARNIKEYLKRST